MCKVLHLAGNVSKVFLLAADVSKAGHTCSCTKAFTDAVILVLRGFVVIIEVSLHQQRHV